MKIRRKKRDSFDDQTGKNDIYTRKREAERKNKSMNTYEKDMWYIH